VGIAVSPVPIAAITLMLGLGLALGAKFVYDGFSALS
jgi:hypothetical protein